MTNQTLSPLFTTINDNIRRQSTLLSSSTTVVVSLASRTMHTIEVLASSKY